VIWSELVRARRWSPASIAGHSSGPRAGRWARWPRRGYERVVRQQMQASMDPAHRPLGELKLRDVRVDRVAAWSQDNERAHAPSTAKLPSWR
jgi:hypothetical protein